MKQFIQWPECQFSENEGTNGDLKPFISLKKKKNVENTRTVSSLCLGRAKTETQLNRVPASVEESKQGRDYT